MNTTNTTDLYGARSVLEPTVRLTDEQVDIYQREGFLAIESFIGSAEVERLRDLYDRLFAATDIDTSDSIDLVAGAKSTNDATIPQIMYPARYLPELLQTQAVANARSIFTQLLGPGAVLNFDHAISKPPHNGAETPWHQDEAYWDPAQEHRSLSIWIALQPATVANGCMGFLPRSHGNGVVGHRHIGADPKVHGLEVLPGTVDVSGAVSCPLPAGGATLHDAQTLHHTGGNTTDSVRRAYILAGAAPTRPRTTNRQFPWRTP